MSVSLKQAIESLSQTIDQLGQPLPQEGPLDLTINGTTYHHIEDSENFYINNPEDSITPLQIMKKEAPDTACSLKQYIEFPPELLKLGTSSRYKVLRAAQIHNKMPPITDETRQFTPMFKYLSTNVKDHWQVQQQFSSARWALNYKDDEAASAVVLYYGWLSSKDPMDGSSMHRITQTDTGIEVEIAYPFSFQERLVIACQEARTYFINASLSGIHATIEDLTKVALRKFYFCNGWHCSITSDYRMAVNNKITAFVEKEINILPDKPNIVPSIDEPEDILPEETIFFPWEAFKFRAGASSAQYEQRKANGAARTLDSIQEKLANYNFGDEITRKELESLGFSNKNITNAKKNGFLLSPKRGLYIINFKKEE